MRAGSLQELVYKQGQAGVTKASVTIVFNNPDPNSSPIGYDTVKQITVTRQVDLNIDIHNYLLMSYLSSIMH